MIQPGQTYRSAVPGSDYRIRIVHVTNGSARAVEAANGRPLPRRIPLAQLHSSSTSPSGRTRRTGYVLEAGQ